MVTTATNNVQRSTVAHADRAHWRIYGHCPRPEKNQMTITEEKRDLFKVDESYNLAHCIASDLGMGAGIAVEMQQRFKLRSAIRKAGKPLKSPTCVHTGRVFNLITKRRSTGKPTYASLRASLKKMKTIVVSQKVERIAMPCIGCGLDRLQWGLVREIIEEVFGDLDVEILICIWR